MGSVRGSTAEMWSFMAALLTGDVPSRTTVSPLSASSRITRTTAAATSSGSTRRPPGFRRAIAATASSNERPLRAATLRAPFHTMSVAAKPGQMRVHGDALAGDLRRQRARETDQRVLGGRVGGDVGRAVKSGQRGDVDHPSPAALEHAGQHGLGHEIGPGGVHVQVALPLGERGPRERCGFGDARVVHQDVDGAELRDHRGHRGGDRSGIRHVERHGEHGPAAGAQLGGGRVQLIPAAGRDRHRQPLDAERQRDRPTETATAAGHERYPRRHVITVTRRPHRSGGPRFGDPGRAAAPVDSGSLGAEQEEHRPRVALVGIVQTPHARRLTAAGRRRRGGDRAAGEGGEQPRGRGCRRSRIIATFYRPIRPAERCI